MKKPEMIDISHAEAESLLSRLEVGDLSEVDRKRCASALRMVFWLQSQLQEAKLSIARLKNLFGIRSEKQG